MRCEWCGCDTDGNHSTLTECIKALQREVELLRAELAKREGRNTLQKPPVGTS